MTCFVWMLLFHDVKLAACRCIKACSELNKTIAVLRLECSIDCIRGSVGHQQNISRSFSHCQRFF